MNDIPLTWAALKTMVTSKSMPMQYIDDGAAYTVFAIDNQVTYTCMIFQGLIPNGVGNVSQVNNDAGKVDFETNFKALANSSLIPRTKDGRSVVQTSVANRFTKFSLRTVSFYSSRSGSIHNVNPVTDLDFGDCLISLTKWNPALNSGSGGWAPALNTDSTRTVLDWEPTYSYEIIGGHFDTPTVLKDGATNAWYFSCVALPDIQSGSVYISEVNIEAVPGQRISPDARSVSYLAYNSGSHTNKLRFIVKHPSGSQQRFQLSLEHFV